MCYRCFYTSKKKFNVQNHLLKNNNNCKKNSLCIISNEDITELNKNQFSKNYKLFKNELNNVVTNIIIKFKDIKSSNQPKYIFNCYKCFFGTNSKNSFLNHFNNGINCIKHTHNTYNSEEIENLNIFQINNINKSKDETNNTTDNYKCYCCGFMHNKKHTLITHFNRKKHCKKYEMNCLSDDEIALLNYNQFRYKKKDNSNKNTIKVADILDKLFEYIRENIFEIFQKRSDIKESVIKFFTDILINNQKQALLYLKNHKVNNLENGY